MRIEERPHALPESLADDLDLITEMTADFARSLDIEETLRIGINHITNFNLFNAENSSENKTSHNPYVQ